MAGFVTLEGLVSLTLTLDRVILHTVVHHSSTSIYMPNFIEIGKTFVDRRTHVRAYTCVRTRMHARMDRRTFETSFIRLTMSKSQPKYKLKTSITKQLLLLVLLLLLL